MGNIINEAMIGFQLEPGEAEVMSEKLSKEILQKVKTLNFDRLVFSLVFLDFNYFLNFFFLLLDTSSFVL